MYFVGTAGWAIPKSARDLFIPEGLAKPNHLLAYSRRFNLVEINSSFYRDHEPQTYRRWRATTPEEFRFAVKLAKRFTHEARLEVDAGELKSLLEVLGELGPKLGPLLVQLPPSLEFDAVVAKRFFATLRRFHTGQVALEPRHKSWIDSAALLAHYRVARVTADPSRVVMPQTTSTFSYFRLHGSPKIYYSSYEPAELRVWATKMTEPEVWCVFDNTALGNATLNALEMNKLLQGRNKKGLASMNGISPVSSDVVVSTR